MMYTLLHPQRYFEGVKINELKMHSVGNRLLLIIIFTSVPTKSIKRINMYLRYQPISRVNGWCPSLNPIARWLAVTFPNILLTACQKHCNYI